MKKYIDSLKALYWTYQNNKKRKKHQVFIHHAERVREIINTVNEEGICIIPAFISSEQCKEIRDDIDRLLREFESHVIKDDTESDQRLFGANNQSTLIEEYFNNQIIRDVIEQFHELLYTDVPGLVMANKVSPRPNNLGSGGGWHRDSVKHRDIKTILYLNDVNESNGPFEYLTKSHRLSSKIESILNHNQRHNQNRLTEADVLSISEQTDCKHCIATGKVGTLVVFDISGIHRGKPIKEGVRYALTNYYWVNTDKGGNSHLMNSLPSILPELNSN